MKFRVTIGFMLSLILLVCFLVYPSELISSAAKGMMLCYEIIIPSLFPFTVISIFIFNCGIFNKIEKIISPMSQKLIGLNSNSFLIIIMSFLGGFPVGAKLINEAVRRSQISTSTANRMLYYCVNPGPAFVIIGIGQGIFKNLTIGYIIFTSNILSSIIICLLLSFVEKRNRVIERKNINDSKRISDVFVMSVYDSTSSIIGICGYVILFSAIIGIVNNIINLENINKLVALLEISNGTIIFSDNIFLMSFLTSFSGICVHMQILSLCKDFKVNYLCLFFAKILSGILSTSLTYILIKIFNITLPVISLESDYRFSLSTKTVLLSGALIFMSIVLLISVKQKYVEIRSNM